MDLPQETDDFIRESIEYTLGLPVSTRTLELKLRASEESQRRLRDQYHYLRSKLKEKDEVIQRVKAESSMNAQAVKKFVEENQKLAVECSNLLNQCAKWERECSLYDHDREALMEFGNEADERAKEAESCVRELKEQLSRLSEELQFYKNRSETEIEQAGTSTESTSIEHVLVDSLLSTLVSEDEVASAALSFLDTNSDSEICQRMLKMWNSLRPSTQKILALASKIKILQEEKDHLRINLTTAEEEVNVLFEANNVLEKENRSLVKQLNKERHYSDSGGKHSSASAKNFKRKAQSNASSPIEKKIDFSDKSPRQALSPLQHNKTPESKVHRK